MTHNDITGEALITKPATPAYRLGWDAIFGKKNIEPTNTENQSTIPVPKTDIK